MTMVQMNEAVASLRAGQIFGDVLSPMYRIEKVNRVTCVVSNFDGKEWYTSRKLYSHRNKEKFVISMDRSDFELLNGEKA